MPEGKTQSKTVKDISDAMGLNLKMLHDISMQRQNKIFHSPNVNNHQKKPRKLTSDKFLITDYLLRNDLKVALTQINSTSEIKMNVTMS